MTLTTDQLDVLATDLIAELGKHVSTPAAIDDVLRRYLDTLGADTFARVTFLALRTTFAECLVEFDPKAAA